MGAVRIMPLGGLGEIGMNSLVLEQAGARVMIDCGVTFDAGDNGIDSYHPRFDAVTDEPDTLVGVLVTHGHEDHIGAVPQLVAALEHAGRTKPLLVWGSPYALALSQRRLDERRSKLTVVPVPVEPRVVFEAGPFQVEPVRVTHSIPAATALRIETTAGTVIHSGDFKLDESPRDGVRSDLTRLRELGDAGVALLMADSTNVLSAGSSASEAVVASTLEALVAAAPHRVVVGLFASNIHRVDAVASAARAAGRKLCLLGRSVRDHVAIARALGVLRWKSDLLLPEQAAASAPRDAVVYVASGTQAEPRGALRRIASRTHRGLRLEAGDELLLSSRIIPGNERAVVAMVDALLAQGVVVRSRIDHPDIHASGHGHRDELRRFLEAVRPRSFIPLHGTRLHLSRHLELAREVGVDDVMSLCDGETAQLDRDGLQGAEPIPCGKVATAFGAVLDDEVIRQRRQIARIGIVTVAVAGERVMVSSCGVPEAARCEHAALARAQQIMGEPASMASPLQEKIRRAVRRQLAEVIGYKPLVEVILWSDAAN